MTKFQLKTPVALIIFKRPDTTERVFETIRQAKPPKLLVVADGPRTDQPGEAEKCAATRAIIDRVDWDCEVLKNYSDSNLGCGLRPATGISWVFEQVEEAIVLEDDCVPHPTFFRFCEELLEYYRHDERIMSISGFNPKFGNRRTEYSYYFSCFHLCWGWASWRRAWRYFDFDMKLWPEIQDGGWLQDFLNSKRTVRFWNEEFEKVYRFRKAHVWDYQWILSCWIQNGLSILPNVNLISNVGHKSVDATHTFDETSRYASMQTEAITFPLNHPSYVVRDTRTDNFTQSNFYDPPTLIRARLRGEKILKKIGIPLNQLKVGKM